MAKKAYVLTIALCLLVIIPIMTCSIHGLGKSMLPTIAPDSLVIYNPFFSGNLTGHVVIYHNHNTEGWSGTPPTEVCHRVIMDQGNTLILKGDNNELYDPAPIPRKDLLGVVFMAFPMYLAVTILAVAYLLIMGCLFKLVTVTK